MLFTIYLSVFSDFYNLIEEKAWGCSYYLLLTNTPTHSLSIFVNILLLSLFFFLLLFQERFLFLLYLFNTFSFFFFLSLTLSISSSYSLKHFLFFSASLYLSRTFLFLFSYSFSCFHSRSLTKLSTVFQLSSTIFVVLNKNSPNFSLDLCSIFLFTPFSSKLLWILFYCWPAQFSTSRFSSLSIFALFNSFMYVYYLYLSSSLYLFFSPEREGEREIKLSSSLFLVFRSPVLSLLELLAIRACCYEVILILLRHALKRKMRPQQSTIE